MSLPHDLKHYRGEMPGPVILMDIGASLLGVAVLLLGIVAVLSLVAP